METFTYTIKNIYNETNEEIKTANHPRMIVKLPINKHLKKYDMMRLKVFDKQEYL